MCQASKSKRSRTVSGEGRFRPDAPVETGRCDFDSGPGPHGDGSTTPEPKVTLSYTDSTADKVSLKLTNGGVLDLYRGPGGDARVLHVSGGRPNKSVLSGTVKGRIRRTSIPVLVGLNGTINTLTTPPFIVGSVRAT
ncbi:MAG: hypothetical protein JWN86_3532 [Planctomycetota bacterium]|nr:hypothetical protein [Planctomycetota bacterium]